MAEEACRPEKDMRKFKTLKPVKTLQDCIGVLKTGGKIPVNGTVREIAKEQRAIKRQN